MEQETVDEAGATIESNATPELSLRELCLRSDVFTTGLCLRLRRVFANAATSENGSVVHQHSIRRQFIWDELDRMERESKGEIPTYFSIDRGSLALKSESMSLDAEPARRDARPPQQSQAQSQKLDLRQLVLDLQASDCLSQRLLY